VRLFSLAEELVRELERPEISSRESLEFTEAVLAFFDAVSADFAPLSEVVSFELFFTGCSDPPLSKTLTVTITTKTNTRTIPILVPLPMVRLLPSKAAGALLKPQDRTEPVLLTYLANKCC